MNYLKKQYKYDKKFLIKHNYLKEQFAKTNSYLKLIKKIVEASDFTLGNFVSKFENKFKNKIKAKYAVGVGSGTDALRLSLEALNIGYKDEDANDRTRGTFHGIFRSSYYSREVTLFNDYTFGKSCKSNEILDLQDIFQNQHAGKFFSFPLIWFEKYKF